MRYKVTDYNGNNPQEIIGETADASARAVELARDVAERTDAPARILRMTPDGVALNVAMAFPDGFVTFR